MLRHTKVRALAALTILLACLAAGRVYGACSNPAGKESDIQYNADYHTYQFCNGTVWIGYGGAGGGGGAMTLLGTQTASGSASLQFTGLPSSYNTLFLNCTGIIPSVDQIGLNVQIGEGAGPTWETGGNYLVKGSAVGNGAFTDQESSTSASLIFTNGHSNAIPASLRVYIDNVGSSAIKKNASYQEDFYWDGSGASWYYAAGTGHWDNDTNPITGLQVIPVSGNITSGQCSLYGMQ